MDLVTILSVFSFTFKSNPSGVVDCAWSLWASSNTSESQLAGLLTADDPRGQTLELYFQKA